MVESDWSIPAGAGRAIVESGAVLVRPLLSTDQFVRYCKKRGLQTSRERLVRLERLRLFAPIFRVRTPPEALGLMRIPPQEGDCWFERGWALDTTAVPATYPVPEWSNRNCEAYYSVFQLLHLHAVLKAFTIQLNLDSYLDRDDSSPIDWDEMGSEMLHLAEVRKDNFQSSHYFCMISLLCQHISIWYYRFARSDKRTVQLGTSFYTDQWIFVDDDDAKARTRLEQWNPKEAESFYSLTSDKLRQAYEKLAIAQSFDDPLENWYELVQFISLHKRDRLTGDALKAETLRGAALMLRALYKDLYGDQLRHPNEVARTVIKPMPEHEVRRDVRRHLEYVANRFGVNPQPRLSLLVEGRSEEVAISRIFVEWLGAHPGVYGIEIVALGGVDQATGGKKARHAMIMRLIDYLHYRQTVVFLLLDNEQVAAKLIDHAKKMRSIHYPRLVTSLEYIQIWEKSFEFDNFSDKELCDAMNGLARGVRFTSLDLSTARNDENPGSSLKALYKQCTGRSIDKVRLCELLTENMLALGPCDIENRPIAQVVRRIEKLAMQNHLPTTQDSSEQNQASSFFGNTLNVDTLQT